MASTYQRISDGRLLLNIVSGGEPAEQRRFGDPASYGSAERYARTDEFLERAPRLVGPRRLRLRG